MHGISDIASLSVTDRWWSEVLADIVRLYSLLPFESGFDPRKDFLNRLLDKKEFIFRFPQLAITALLICVNKDAFLGSETIFKIVDIVDVIISQSVPRDLDLALTSLSIDANVAACEIRTEISDKHSNFIECITNLEDILTALIRSDPCDRWASSK
jgi:hypothetical protein